MKNLNAYILLDRSGSMSSRWGESINSVNIYVEELAKGDAKSKVTLATFDSPSGDMDFDVIRDDVSSKKWEDVNGSKIHPRGMTPLFDAIGKIVALAEKADEKKSIIVVMTDGAENCSREINKEQAKSMIERCKKKGWEVIFLGADFDAFGEASSVGVSMGKTMNMAAGNYGSTMRSMAEKTVLYASANVDISFSAEDREEAKKGKKS